MDKRTLRARGLVGLLLVCLFVLSMGSASAGPDKGQDEGSGPLSKDADQVKEGSVWIPQPRGVRTAYATFHKVTHFQLTDLQPRAPYVLEAKEAGGVSTCVVAICVQTADFDISFYSAEGAYISTATSVGNEAGRVPRDAAFGIVYLQTPGLVPTAKGHEFVYRQGSPGSDTLPGPVTERASDQTLF